MNLKEALELFFSAKKHSEATRHQYRHTLETHFEHLGGPERDVTTVTKQEIAAWAKKQKEFVDDKLSFWTINGRLKDAKAFWKWLVDAGHIVASPAKELKVKRFKPNKMRKVAMSDQDLSRLLRHAAQHSERALAIVRLIADTGCRRAAVVKLRLRDIDFANGFAILVGKGGKTYEVAFSSRLIKALKSYLMVRPHDLSHDYVFVSERKPHGPLKLNGLSTFWRRLTQEIEFTSKHNMHAVRHNFASRLARKDYNMVYIQEALGHEDLETTRLYVKACRDRLKDIVEDASME